MRALVAAATVLVIVGVLALRSDASHLRCHTGDALGFVALRTDPPHLVGTLPSRFTGEDGYFTARYNCTRQSVQARRVDEGVYEVRFPGVMVHVAVTDALSVEGVATSVQVLGGGVVRVALRGPLAGSDVASRRDVAFSVVVY